MSTVAVPGPTTRDNPLPRDHRADSKPIQRDSAEPTVCDAQETKPRLAYLVSQYPAISHTFILREVRQLRRLGFAIEVTSVNAPDRATEGLTDEEQDEAQQTTYLKRQGVLGALGAHLRAVCTRPLAYLRGLAYSLQLGGTDPRRLLYALFYFAEAVMVGQWMMRKALPHLHVHFATPASTVGLIASRMYPITYSLTVHGPDEFYDAPGYRLAEKITGADFVCCIGMYARSQLMKLSMHNQWDKFEISPLGVDIDQFTPVPPRDASQPFEVICVGRLVPAKGQHILIEAIATLAAEGRDIRLRVVGDGPDRASLEHLAKQRGVDANVVFEGAVNQDRIRALYANADAFALASFAEGIPVVLMEAMSMEIPCVTTFITGHPELIRSGVDGLLVAPSDIEGLSAALTQLIVDPEYRRTLGKNGRKRVDEKYHLERNTKRLASIFERRLS